jgi:DNA-binding transcriptional ArsR family regulator
VVVQLRFGPDDLLRCRFALSPLWETNAAVRTVVEPHRYGHHLPWLRGIRDELRRLDLAPLLALMPARGFTPDFLTPPPLGPLAGFDEELERFRAIRPEQAERELRRSLYDRPDGPHPAADELLADPAATIDRLARSLAGCWATLVRPWWPRLRDLLDADIAVRARRLADGGLAGLLADLDPHVSWRDGTVQVEARHDERRALGGAGLVLMPSAFVWPGVAVVLDEPWQPTLIYPARGIAALWSPPPADVPAALGRLLGATRARLLLGLTEPATTTALARRFGISPAGISGHLTTLRDTGLVTGHRVGRRVLYERTPLGAVLTGAPEPRGGADREAEAGANPAVDPGA